MDSSAWNTLGSRASTLVSRYPENAFNDLYTDYKLWDDETYRVGTKIYDNISENTLPSDSYIKTNVAIAE
jgi:hypothetical protein